MCKSNVWKSARGHWSLFPFHPRQLLSSGGQFTSFHFPQTALVAVTVTLTGSGYNLGHQKGLDWEHTSPARIAEHKHGLWWCWGSRNVEIHWIEETKCKFVWSHSLYNIHIVLLLSLLILKVSDPCRRSPGHCTTLKPSVAPAARAV